MQSFHPPPSGNPASVQSSSHGVSTSSADNAASAAPNSINTHHSAAPGLYSGISPSPLDRSLLFHNLPNSIALRPQPNAYAAPPVPHTGTVHTTLPSPRTAAKVSHTTSTNVHSVPKQRASDSTPCPVHGRAQGAPNLHTPPYPYCAKPYYMPMSPYYQFVPLYRTMKVVGHFQPIPSVGMPSATIPPASLAPGLSHSPSQSQADAATSSSVNQSKALDLSTPKSSGTREEPRANRGKGASDGESERKKPKTEPPSP